MQNKDCLGCRTHFKDNEKLPLEGISIELKNYNFPIKEAKHKWNLLKTICSLLNSKGGTIYIGAEDKTGEIKGYAAERKELDDFRLFVQQLSQRIRPAVDLSDKEEIMVQYVPILTQDRFSGRHLIKIVVKQGDPHQLYCFSQKIQIQEGPNKTEEFQIVYAYKRLNAGNIKELKGYELVEEATKKGKTPSRIANTFHEDCNPEPPNLTTSIFKIAFKNIYFTQSYSKLEQWLSANLLQLGCKEQLLSYDEEYDMLVIDFGSSQEKQLQKALAFLEKKVGEISQFLPNYKFTRKETFLDCFQFENVMKKVVVKEEKKKENEEEEDWEDEEDEQKEENWEDYSEEEEEEEEATKTKEHVLLLSKIPTKVSKPEKKVYVKQECKEEAQTKKIPQTQIPLPSPPMAINVPKKQNPPQKSANHSKRYSLTFTHILPQRNKELADYLKSLAEGAVEAKVYLNSVQIFLSDWKELKKYSKVIEGRKRILSEDFGFSQRMDIGENQSEIQIRNYDNKKYLQMKKFLEELIGHDLQICRSIKKGNKYSLGLLFHNTSLTCKWLDMLLKNKEIRQFGIAGADRGNAPKLKYHLLVKEI